MITASVQTSADSGPFLPYAAGVVLFLAGTAAFIAVCWAVDRYLISPRLRRHIDRALHNGDRRALRAVTEMETVRHRTVPKQLTATKGTRR